MPTLTSLCEVSSSSLPEAHALPAHEGPTKVMGETEGGAEMGSDPSEHSADIRSQLLTTYRPFSLLTEPGSIQLSLKLD